MEGEEGAAVAISNKWMKPGSPIFLPAIWQLQGYPPVHSRNIQQKKFVVLNAPPRYYKDLCATIFGPKYYPDTAATNGHYGGRDIAGELWEGGKLPRKWQLTMDQRFHICESEIMWI